MNGLAYRAAVLGVLLLGGGCSIVGLNGESGDLANARALWESVRPVDYSYAIIRQCFCAGRGPVRVTVSGAQVVARVWVEDGLDVEGDARDWFPTVDGLFDILEDAVARDAHRIDVLYDPDTGIPVDFWIDYQEFTADEELGFEVVEAMRPLG